MEFPRIENFIHILVFFLSITTEASHKLSWIFFKATYSLRQTKFSFRDIFKGFPQQLIPRTFHKTCREITSTPPTYVEKSSSIFYAHFRIDELENLEILREKNALLSTIINHLSMWYHKNNKESKYNIQCSGMPFRSNYETLQKFTELWFFEIFLRMTLSSRTWAMLNITL